MTSKIQWVTVFCCVAVPFIAQYYFQLSTLHTIGLAVLFGAVCGGAGTYLESRIQQRACKK